MFLFFFFCSFWAASFDELHVAVTDNLSHCC